MMRTNEPTVAAGMSRGLSFGSVQWRDARRQDHLTAIVKAAFSLSPGVLELRTEPPPLGAGGDLSGDLVPLKASADVVVVGPLASGPLASGSCGRRLLRLSLARAASVLLDKCLLAVGQGPTLVAVDGAEPALEPSVGPDSERSGADDEDGLPTLGEELDAATFQRAPADQRVPFLLGGEQLRLVNLVDGYPELRCRLPALHAWAAVQVGGEARPVPLVADTLVVDLGARTVMVTWRGFVRLEDGEAAQELPVEGGLLPIQALEEVRGEPPEWRKDRAQPPLARPFAASDLLNRTPLAVATVPFKRGAAGWERALVVKGTFDIVAGERATLAPSQLPIEGDRVESGGGLDYPSDAAPFKPQADVLLCGRAYRRPDEDIALVTLELGDVRKRVVAVGDRRWTSRGELSEPETFESIPLSYERAFGGPGFAANPIGTGFGGSKPPNLELPDRLIRTTEDEPPVAGFGALPLSWRTASGGSYDRAWLERGWPAVADDFDPALFNAAPADQRCAYPRGDERFAVHRVRPGGEALQGLLPAVTPRAWARRRGETSLETVALVLDTVVVDAEAEQLIVVWRGSLPVADDEASDLDKLLVALGEELDDDMAWALLEGADKSAPRRTPSSRTVGEVLAAGLPAPALLTASPRIRDLAILPALPPPASRDQIERWLASPDGLKGRDLTGADLRGVDLREKDMSQALLAHACLDGVVLDDAQLSGATLTNASAVGASFRDAVLAGVDATDARLAEADLEGAELTQAVFDGADLSAASLRGVRAPGSSLVRARLDRACLDDADLSAADLSGASLEGTSARQAVLDNAKLYDCEGADTCFDGASLLDARLERAQLPSLSACDLRARGSVWDDAQLEGARLLRSDFEEASFEGALLDAVVASEVIAPRARFVRASLVGASLLRADLMQASFEKADLSGADLRGASLYQAETWGANMDGARLEQAHLAGTKLAGQ